MPPLCPKLGYAVVDFHQAQLLLLGAETFVEAVENRHIDAQADGAEQKLPLGSLT